MHLNRDLCNLKRIIFGHFSCRMLFLNPLIDLRQIHAEEPHVLRETNQRMLQMEKIKENLGLISTP